MSRKRYRPSILPDNSCSRHYFGSRVHNSSVMSRLTMVYADARRLGSQKGLQVGKLPMMHCKYRIKTYFCIIHYCTM